jgi:hypothetical protein
MLNGWIRINPAGTVTVFTGKCELGQGILTALAQIAAEELDVAYERVEIVSADTAHTPNEGMTAGSLSVENSGTALRFACAEARAILLELAAAKLRVAVANLSVSDGTVTGSGKVTYWELAREANLEREASAQAKPKPPAHHRIVGRSIPRRDIPAKMTGGAGGCPAWCMAAWCGRHAMAPGSRVSTRPKSGRCRESSRCCVTAAFSAWWRGARSRRSMRGLS